MRRPHDTKALTERKCRRCGVPKVRRACAACHAAYMRRWRIRNIENVKREKKAYYQKNRSKIIERHKRNASDGRYREHARQYYLLHREAILEKFRTDTRSGRKAKSTERVSEWREKNRDYVREQDRLRYARTKDSFAVSAKKWRAANPDKCAVHRTARRSRLLKALGSHGVDEVAKIRKMQQNRCAACAEDIQGKGHVDHIVALSKGGTNDRRNLQILCKSCNSRKADLDPIEFMRRLGRLL